MPQKNLKIFENFRSKNNAWLRVTDPKTRPRSNFDGGGWGQEDYTLQEPEDRHPKQADQIHPKTYPATEKKRKEKTGPGLGRGHGLGRRWTSSVTEKCVYTGHLWPVEKSVWGADQPKRATWGRGVTAAFGFFETTATWNHFRAGELEKKTCPVEHQNIVCALKQNRKWRKKQFYLRNAEKGIRRRKFGKIFRKIVQNSLALGGGGVLEDSHPSSRTGFSAHGDRGGNKAWACTCSGMAVAAPPRRLELPSPEENKKSKEERWRQKKAETTKQ